MLLFDLVLFVCKMYTSLLPESTKRMVSSCILRTQGLFLKKNVKLFSSVQLLSHV